MILTAPATVTARNTDCSNTFDRCYSVLHLTICNDNKATRQSDSCSIVELSGISGSRINWMVERQESLSIILRRRLRQCLIHGWSPTPPVLLVGEGQKWYRWEGSITDIVIQACQKQSYIPTWWWLHSTPQNLCLMRIKRRRTAILQILNGIHLYLLRMWV